MKVTGGQAILGGVAMRTSTWRVAVVRRISGEIVHGAVRARPSRLASMPVVRGVFGWFVDAPTEPAWAADVVVSDGPPPELLPPGRRSFVRVAAALLLLHGVLQLATYAALRALHRDAAPASISFQGAMAAGILLLGLLYLRFIGRIEDVRGLFRLNGAFKMALWAANDAEEPTPAMLRRHPAWCPWSSVVAFAVVTVFLAVLTPLVLLPFAASQGPGLVPHLVTWGARVVLTPVAVGLVEEGLRALVELGNGPVVRVALAPIALLERLVVRAPDEASLEVAALALRDLRSRCREPDR